MARAPLRIDEIPYELLPSIGTMLRDFRTAFRVPHNQGAARKMATVRAERLEMIEHVQRHRRWKGRRIAGVKVIRQLDMQHAKWTAELAVLNEALDRWHDDRKARKAAPAASADDWG